MGMKVTVKNVSKYFGKQVALRDISLEMQPGEVYGLLGTNGAGKSTMMKILTGILSFDEGVIQYDDLEFRSNYATIKSRFGLVPQNVAFYQDFTVEQNLRFFGMANNWGGKALRERMDFLMDWLSLKEFAKKKGQHLSGGYQRLLNIAITLLPDPDVVFFDEPTVGLDPSMRKMFWDKIDELRDQQKTICLTTHYMDEAQNLCDYVGIIEHGQLVTSGDPMDLVEKYGGKKIAVLALNRIVDPEFAKSLQKIMTESEIHVFNNTLVVTLPQAKSLDRLSLVTDFLEKKGYDIQNSIIKEPDLENVFMNLTGKNFRE